MEFDKPSETTVKSNEADKNVLNLATLTAEADRLAKPVQRVAIEPKSGDSFGQRPGEWTPLPFPGIPGGQWGGNGWPDGGIICGDQVTMVVLIPEIQEILEFPVTRSREARAIRLTQTVRVKSVTGHRRKNGDR